MYYDKYGSGKRGGRWLTGLALLVLGIFLVSGWLISSNYHNLGNFFKVISLVRSQYLYQVNSPVLVEGAIKGMVNELGDPYSVYLDQKTFSQLQEQIKGSFGGLGILVGVKDDYLTVVRTYQNTPAHRKGIIAGDVITGIGGRDARGIDLDTAIQLMRGPVGTEITLTLIRRGKDIPFKVNLTREEISVPTVEGKMLADKIGYIVLSQFTEKTPQELGTVINKFKKEGMRGVLLDLRDNPGGELQSVVKVSSYFVPKGPVVYIEYRGDREEVLSSGGGNLGLPLVVLVNEGSASAAEILAGAVKDTGSGTLVGQKTFGKGVVQTVFELGNGAGLKLTTASYLTPGRHDINKKGIIPDIEVQYDAGSQNDAQLDRGLEILKEKLERSAA